MNGGHCDSLQCLPHLTLGANSNSTCAFAKGPKRSSEARHDFQTLLELGALDPWVWGIFFRLGTTVSPAKTVGI